MENLLPYYERELAYLRRYSEDFAQRYPKPDTQNTSKPCVRAYVPRTNERQASHPDTDGRTGRRR